MTKRPCEHFPHKDQKQQCLCFDEKFDVGPHSSSRGSIDAMQSRCRTEHCSDERTSDNGEVDSTSYARKLQLTADCHVVHMNPEKLEKTLINQPVEVASMSDQLVMSDCPQHKKMDTYHDHKEVDRLTIKHLNLILNKTWDARYKWEFIGLELGISQDDLDVVKRRCRENPDDCLKDILTDWLRRDFPLPTCLTIAEALRAKCVGYGHLAVEVEQLLNQVDTSIGKPSPFNMANNPVFQCPCQNCSLKSYMKDGCPRSNVSFPHLVLSELSRDDRENLTQILSNDFKEINKKFSNLFDNVCESLQSSSCEVTPKKLARRVIGLRPAQFSESHEEKLVTSKDIDESFIILRKYMSFFNFELLVYIIEWKLCPDENRKLLKEYREKLSDFCRRKVFEVPPNAYSDMNDDETKHTKFVALLPDDNQELSLNNVFSDRQRIADLLGLDVSQLYLHKIDKGSLILVLSVPESVANRLFPLDCDLMYRLKAEGYVILTATGFQSQWKKAVWNMYKTALDIIKCSCQSVQLKVIKEDMVTHAEGIEQRKQEAILKKDTGNTQLKQEEYELAFESYTEAMELDPNNAVIPANRAMALIKLERYEEAVVDCSQSLNLDHTYIKAYFRRATARGKLGKLKDARKDYQSVLQLDSKNKEAQAELARLEEIIHQQAVKIKEKGNVHLKDGNYALAVEMYTEAMELDPHSAVIPADRAIVFIKLGRYAEAEGDCSLSLKQDNNYVKAYLRRATAREKLDKLEDAILDYQSVLRFESDNKHAKTELAKLEGDIQLKRKDFESAISSYSKAMELAPLTSDMLVRRARALIQLHRYEEAEGDCTSALNLDKKCVEAYCRRADAKVMLCKLEEAKQDYQYALQLQPDDEAIQKEIENLETDVMRLIDKNSCECYNESLSHPYQQALNLNDSEYLESEEDENGQLMIYLPFQCPVKLMSLQLVGPTDGRAPKTIKLFINQLPTTLDIDKARQVEAVQELILTEADIKDNAVIHLKCCKFHQIHSVTLLVVDNQGGEKTTVINHLKLTGIPIGDVIPRDMPVTRVSGEVGEYCKKPTFPKATST